MNTRTRHILVVFVITLLGLSFAQQEELNPYAFLTTPAEIATVIDGTHREILISSSSIYHPEVAEALRRAVVSRNVPVFILTSANGANAANSYIHSLHLQGASVRVGAITDPLIVLDREAVVSGPLITGPVPVTDDTATFLLSDPNFINQAVNIIIDLFEDALPFEYVPEAP